MNTTPIPVIHLITRLIVGGAQENTLFTAALLPPTRYSVLVVSGAQTGREGSLIEEARQQGIRLNDTSRTCAPGQPAQRSAGFDQALPVVAARALPGAAYPQLESRHPGTPGWSSRRNAGDHPHRAWLELP